MSTRDHFVPQMYLRRFAQRRSGGKKGHYLSALPLDDPGKGFSCEVKNAAVEGDFHWYTEGDGSRHHGVEQLMTELEGLAAKGFAAMLDDEYAFPTQWPLPSETRGDVALWIAAQLLRTAQRREWVDFLASQNSPGGIPDDPQLEALAKANRHLDYLLQNIMGLGRILYLRPWALGYSQMCLPTSDNPVVSGDGNYREFLETQIGTWDLFLPLDSHRFLLLPSDRLVQGDPRKRRDHFTMFEGALGNLVVQLVVDWAGRHVFHHPKHYPFAQGLYLGSRVPQPWGGHSTPGPQGLIGNYPVLLPGRTLERRYLDEHVMKPEYADPGPATEARLRQDQASSISSAVHSLRGESPSGGLLP